MSEHDPTCTGCKHDCPWQRNPLGSPFCSICDDHMEAEASRHQDDCAIWKNTVSDCTCDVAQQDLEASASN